MDGSTCAHPAMSTIPPWRGKSLWRITTTKAVEGLLTDNQSSGYKKKMEELCEMMKKKHAKEYADLLQECEEGKQRDQESEKEPNDGVEWKDQELKVKVEEILTFMKEMSRGQKEKRRGQSKKR